MSACRWDSEREDYLIDGEPCRHDAYGDPTKHCTARRTCSEHVGWGELTCARCVGRTRMDIKIIRDRAAELWPVALYAGVNSEAANLVGPAADHRVFEARRSISRTWIYSNITRSARNWCDDPDDCPKRHFKTAAGDRWHKRGIENAIADLLPEDDDQHPYSVLCRWQMMLAEDYRDQLPDIMGIAGAADYLERILAKVAQDESQDFPLFAREIRKCRNHLENVLSDSQQPERGAPCPDCKDAGKVVRLHREHGHWCEDMECALIHYLDDSGDRWVCPANKAHWMTAEGYAEWLRERTTA